MAVRRRSVVQACVLVACGLAAEVSVGRKGLPAAALSPSVPRVEYRFRVEAQRAVGAAFASELDALVARLRKAGVRIARVLPEPDRALLDGDGLDAKAVSSALAHSQLLSEPAASEVASDGTSSGRQRAPLRVRLRDDAARRARETAILAAARSLRARVLAAKLCAACEPTVERADDVLILRLPQFALDQATERRMLAAINEPPNAPPLSPLGRTSAAPLAQ